MTDALLAYSLADPGLDVVVLDRRDVATGSTAASTPLLQYEVDVELQTLIELIGADDAVRAYRLLVEAVQEIERLVGELGDDCGFSRKSSLYLASRRGDVARLERGANGITFGVIAARILTDLCTGTPNKDARIFSLNR